jgi:hypothetical protein
MGRTLRILLPCALGLVAALLVSCGDTSNLIPGTDADAINKNVDAASNAAASGRCGAANAAVNRAELHVRKLPSKVDGALRADLEQGLEKLRVAAARECTQNNQTTATTESTQSTQTTATTESTASTATTDTQTQTTDTQTTPTQTTDTSGGGGGNTGGGGTGGGGGGTGAPGGSGGGTAAP